MDTDAGQLFTLHFEPQDPPRALIIHIPAYGEEMNRMRHICLQQGEMFARAGYYCISIDLYGTGDSSGELADATWAVWKAGVISVINSVNQQRKLKTILWGTRLGGLLAADVANSAPEDCDALLLWQPVTAGRGYMTQVLRQRVAKLVDRGEKPETTKEIRENLAAGQAVEVGGYVLGGQLVADIDEVELLSMPALKGKSLHWVERSNTPGGAVPVARTRVDEYLRGAGNAVKIVELDFPPLWELPRRADMSQLLAGTTALPLT